MSTEIDIQDIQTRLEACFQADVRLVFWEDAASEYAEIVDSVSLGGAKVVNASRHELATKRRILKEEPSTKFVVYREGEIPPAIDDLLLDIKLAAVPFSCSMEGIWASECGIPAHLISVIGDHSSFFNNKERRSSLAQSKLPKEDADQLRFAMLAATLKSDDAEPRDAVRSFIKRVLVEWAKGDEVSMRILRDAGLEQTFWAACKQYVDYDVAQGDQRTVEDLAFCLLEGKCGNAVEDERAADTAESSRILGNLAQDAHTREVYDAIEEKLGSNVANHIPEANRSVDILEDIDAIPLIDEWILAAFLAELEAGGLDSTRLERVWSRRRYMLYAGKYEPYYQCLIALVGFKAACASYAKKCGLGTDLDTIFTHYCDSWYMVDRSYREFFCAYGKVSAGRFKNRIGDSVHSVEAEYNNFLINLTDRWQLHLLDQEKWPPESIDSQDGFFRRYVELNFPRAEKGKRVGVIVSDALRFEAGKELSTRLAKTKERALAGKISVSCSGELCMLPSYTQLGMAALLPDGAMEIDPASTRVTKGGQPTAGVDARGKLISHGVEGGTALAATEVLASPKLDTDGVPVVYIYHNTIDKTGDSRDTETKVFDAVEQAFSDIEQLVRMLVQAGCGKIFVTADHGFLYQNEKPESYAYASIDNLSTFKAADDVSCDYTRRFIVGKTIPASDMLIEYAALDLSLEGDYHIAMPKGITRLRLSGSGARFVHGGASLQENVVPVVKVKVAASKTAHATSVEGYVQGRTVITGPSVPLIVYQCEPCMETVSPLTVKVGVYSKDGQLLSDEEKTLELDSASADVEDRKTHLSLPLIDEVDEHQSVYVRILKREGSTNSFKTAWEQEYSVNRAFGMDF